MIFAQEQLDFGKMVHTRFPWADSYMFENRLKRKTVFQKRDKFDVKTVADPGFSRGGGVNPPGGREHAKFSRKLHEIERIWTPRGGRASLTPP